MARISETRSRAIFGHPSPPRQVSEYQFDGFDDDLRRLAQTPWDQIQEADLWYYLHDLAYVQLQDDLFAYLFPVCLNFWHHSLMQSQPCAVGDSEFHFALWRSQILEKYVTASQREQIDTFFHDAFLDRLDQERGFVYRVKQAPAFGWIHRFNSLGIVTPLIDRLWTSWWRMDSAGQAVTALVYLSGLMYKSGGNPIFKDWTREYGAVPYLWQNDSQIFDQGWRPENIAFLKRALAADTLRQGVHDACQRLENESEAQIANKICADFDLLAEDVEIRVLYLLERLEAERHAVYLDW